MVMETSSSHESELTQLNQLIEGYIMSTLIEVKKRMAQCKTRLDALLLMSDIRESQLSDSDKEYALDHIASKL